MMISDLMKLKSRLTKIVYMICVLDVVTYLVIQNACRIDEANPVDQIHCVSFIC